MDSSSSSVTTMIDNIASPVVEYLQDPNDRASFSLVNKYWYELDRLSRRHISISFSYSTTPQRLLARFPNIESLKIKGQPRAATFGLISEDWGAYARPWVESFHNFPKLVSLHFKRMIVFDDDLLMMALMKDRQWLSFKLDHCYGFSTEGLLAITQNCRRLNTLVLEGSKIIETNGEWLHSLALNNTALTTLNFCNTTLDDISVEDLQLLATKCPLVSLKIGDTELVSLRNFFKAALTLREFVGGLFLRYENYNNFSFPPHLTSLGFINFESIHMPMINPIAPSLMKLDLLYSSLTCEGHCEVIRACPNLESLKTTNIIGDEGVEALAVTCKNLKKLRIEMWEQYGDPDTVVEGLVGVSQRGLHAIAEGCGQLEYLAVYVRDITNAALRCIGAKLKNLIDFRLSLDNLQVKIADSPLDLGVRALLQGCHNIQRFALKLSRGGLTDVGLGYLGECSPKVKWMLLGNLGETDKGLLDFANGCPSLQKLELRGCHFSEQALAIAANQLTSLRFLWVQVYIASPRGDRDILEFARPCWTIERIPGNINGDIGGQIVTSQIIAYYSLTGPRRDHPQTVHLVTLPNH